MALLGFFCDSSLLPPPCQVFRPEQVTIGIERERESAQSGERKKEEEDRRPDLKDRFAVNKALARLSPSPASASVLRS